MSEMINRVAIALKESLPKSFIVEDLRTAARAAIEAMLETTSDMKWAAIGASPENKTWGEVDELRWRAMIDAALGKIDA